MTQAFFGVPAAAGKWLDKTPMYIVVSVALGVVVLCTFVLSLLGLGSASIFSMASSFFLISLVCVLTSGIFGRLFRVTAHHLSSFITAMILFLLLSPATTVYEYEVLAGVAFVAVLSKYVLVYRRQHLVNPAAISIVLLAFSGFGAATWWVATPYMFVPLILAGAAIVTKMRAWWMVTIFAVVGLGTFLFEGWRLGDVVTSSWYVYFISYPTLFLGFFMLTEPFTLPPTRTLRFAYAALVGFLGSTFLFPALHLTPELALVIGNLAAYPFTLKRKLLLSFVSKRELGPLLYELTFQKPRGLTFTAGQYVEWMLPHEKSDSRGIRRYFTIVSAPTDSFFKVACKVPTPGSSYKQALLSLVPGDIVVASQLAGDFVLPKNPQTKIGWIAGGIGVTPFVSQASYLQDTQSVRDIALLYAANSPAELVYGELLAESAKLVPVLSQGTLPGSESGYLTADMIVRRVPDYLERTWYVSGPSVMVNAATDTLRTIGVSKKNIVSDFFPGLA